MRFTDGFYTGQAWKLCRAGYVKSQGGLCERCRAEGYIVPGTQVHHKVRLTPRNITDPSIALNWDNLELLCDDCHEREHGKHKQRADANGHVNL